MLVKTTYDVLKACRPEHRPSRHTYYVAVRGFIRSGSVEWARRVIDLMQEHGMSPDSRFYAAILQGLAQHRPDLAAVKAVLDEMREKGVEPGVVGWSMAIRAYAVRGDMATASNLFADMIASSTTPVLLTYNSLIIGSRSYPEAKRMLERMALANLQPDRHTTYALLRVCASTKDPTAAEEVLRLAAERGETPSLSCYSLLLASYLNAGDFAGVLAVYRRMEAASIALDAHMYQVLIFACEQRAENIDDKYVQLAVDVFAIATKEGQCSYRVWVALLRVFVAVDDVKSTRRVAEHMERKMGLTPSVQTLVDDYFKKRGEATLAPPPEDMQ